MLFDYAERVENVKYGTIEDPTINRAIAYINETIHKNSCKRYC